MLPVSSSCVPSMSLVWSLSGLLQFRGHHVKQSCWLEFLRYFNLTRRPAEEEYPCCSSQRILWTGGNTVKYSPRSSSTLMRAAWQLSIFPCSRECHAHVYCRCGCGFGHVVHPPNSTQRKVSGHIWHNRPHKLILPHMNT